MRHDPVYRPITADEFLEMDFGTDKRFELHRGVIYMMAGGSEPHAWVQGNIFSWLRARLRGTGCRPYGPDMAMRISDIDIRYPDISIYCDQPPRDALTQAKLLDNPTVVIEILSLTTAMFDQGTFRRLLRRDGLLLPFPLLLRRLVQRRLFILLPLQ